MQVHRLVDGAMFLIVTETNGRRCDKESENNVEIYTYL